MKSVQLLIATASAFLLSGAAHAGPINYDCDTPADKFSSLDISTDTTRFIVKGKIAAAVFRAGKYLPVANVHVGAPRGSDGVLLRLMAPSGTAKQAEIIVQTMQGSKPIKRVLGQILLGESLDFSIEVLPNAAVNLTVNGQQMSLKTEFASSSNLTISCSTGEFKFDNLEWSSG